jgi:VanZ family protein
LIEVSIILNFDVKIFRWLAWIAVIALAVLSLVPGEFRPHFTTSQYNIEHFAAYFLTSAVVALAYRATIQSALAIVFFLAIYAGLLETAQLWIPGREARFTDFIASTLGVVAGILFVSFVRWIRKRKTESMD